MLHLWNEKLKKLSKTKSYRKVIDHCHYTGKYRGAARSIYNLKFNVPNESLVAFHNGSNYDLHFIIKKLSNKIKIKFECLGEAQEG